MEVGEFKRIIAIAVAEAEQAADPRRSGLLDYGDLQRLVGRMTKALRYAERSYDELVAEHAELAEHRRRPLPHQPSPPDDQTAFYS